MKTTIRITAEEDRALEACSVQFGLSRLEIVRRAIRAYARRLDAGYERVVTPGCRKDYHNQERNNYQTVIVPDVFRDVIAQGPDVLRHAIRQHIQYTRAQDSARQRLTDAEIGDLYYGGRVPPYTVVPCE